MEPGPNHLMVEYTSALANERLAKRTSALWVSLLGFGLLVALMVGVLLYNRSSEPWKDKEYQLWFSVIAGLALLRILWAMVAFLVARRYVNRIPQGIAMVISRDGIATSEQSWGWSAIQSIGTQRRVIRGPDFAIRGQGAAEPVWLAVEDLTAFPATIDAAVRIYSGGTCRIDLSGIDR